MSHYLQYKKSPWLVDSSFSKLMSKDAAGFATLMSTKGAICGTERTSSAVNRPLIFRHGVSIGFNSGWNPCSDGTAAAVFRGAMAAWSDLQALRRGTSHQLARVGETR